MNTALTVFNTIVPVFFIVLFGVYARKRQWLDEDDVMRFNRVAFNLFAPIMCFYNLYHSQVSLRENAGTLLFCLFGLAAVWLAGALLARRLSDDPHIRTVLLLSFYHSNFLMLIYPVAQNLYGTQALGKVSIITGLLVASFNLFAAFSSALFQEGKPGAGKLLRAVVGNPIIMGCLAALLLNRLSIGLPYFLDTAFSMMAQAASPLMLFLLGAMFAAGEMHPFKRYIGISALLRLILIPLVLVSLGAALGFRGVDLLLILIVFAAPSGVLVFSMAKERRDTQLASGLVIFSSAASCITLGLWMAVLLQLHLL